MRLSREGVEAIREWEELRLKGYLPTPNDRWTVGWGHCGRLLDGSLVGEGCEIELGEAEELFWRDVGPAVEAVNGMGCRWSQGQFDALVSLVFNVGLGGFEKSRLRKALLGADWEAAEREWRDWDHQGRRELAGLKRRREAEWERFRAGVGTVT